MSYVNGTGESGGAVYAPPSPADEEKRKPRRRRIRNTALFFLFEAALLLFLAAKVSSHSIRDAVIYGEFAVLFLWIQGLPKLKKWTYQLGHRGDYELALRLNRIWLKIPGYGSSLEGPILFNAGRYSEARAFLKPLAFDAQGKPRLASVELYTYALALENDGQVEEAEGLLEAAVEAYPHKDVLQMALATCLLTEEKEPGRACKLIEEAMASPAKSGPTDRATRVARYSYALASCGRRQEAEVRIAEALAAGRGLEDCDLAGVYYFVGEAWRALGETEKAHAAFGEALRLAPQGVTALSVRKAEAKMTNKWYAWQPGT